MTERNEIKTVTELMDNSGIAPRFENATFQSFKPINTAGSHCLDVCQTFAQSWEDRLKAGEGLILCGRTGTGKTHLACAIARDVIENHRAEAFITTAQRIIRAFRRTWNHKSEHTEDEAIRFYTSRDLLIIDEIGVQYGTDSERNILFEVINTRYEFLLPTILISNFTDVELAEFLGERTLDRMTQGGAVLAFDWESQRRSM